MAVLFRPWALPGERLNQDATISTTTVSDINLTEIKESSNADVPREVEFKSVREHVRRRSEKKSKRLRHVSEKLLLPSLQSPQTVSDGRNAYPPSPLVTCTRSCLPPSQLPLFDSVSGRNYSESWEDLALMSPDLLEAAISHGLPPSLVEDYARLLTEQQRQIAERSRKQRPKKFRCPHCHVGFSNNGQLKGHIRIHTGERPFKCDAEQCGKSFTRNEELTRHRRIHSGLRPFPCPECGKRFGRKDHLKKHVRTHFQQRFQLVPIYPSQFPYLFGL